MVACGDLLAALATVGIPEETVKRLVMGLLSGVYVAIAIVAVPISLCYALLRFLLTPLRKLYDKLKK
jgi:hypothetical protein